MLVQDNILGELIHTLCVCVRACVWCVCVRGVCVCVRCVYVRAVCVCGVCGVVFMYGICMFCVTHVCVWIGN